MYADETSLARESLRVGGQQEEFKKKINADAGWNALGHFATYHNELLSDEKHVLSVGNRINKERKIYTTADASIRAFLLAISRAINCYYHYHSDISPGGGDDGAWGGSHRTGFMDFRIGHAIAWKFEFKVKEGLSGVQGEGSSVRGNPGLGDLRGSEVGFIGVECFRISGSPGSSFVLAGVGNCNWRDVERREGGHLKLKSYQQKLYISLMGKFELHVDARWERGERRRIDRWEGGSVWVVWMGLCGEMRCSRTQHR
ncbi:hypothetical protein BDZ91DRAFT_764478 [Kalaharituber pfeilii]|nr:hypothetical protein BDZ91DRAFT_764478 [Kalaharituber pfeilii]